MPTSVKKASVAVHYVGASKKDLSELLLLYVCLGDLEVPVHPL